MQTAREKKFSFGEFELDANKRLLFKQGKAVSLNPKTLDLLLTLIENRGEISSKNDLLDKVWENQFVEENNLTVHVAALRKVLGETKNEHRFIVTVPGKGYSFVAEVFAEDSSNENSLTVSQLENRILMPDDFDESESLIGRGREISIIKNLLRDENSGLVVLTGAGGSGKTALARFAADELTSDFSEGVYFVELAFISNAELIISTIAKNLGIEETGGKSLFDRLRNFLTQKKILLVLDNFEQLLPAGVLLVEELLSASKLLKILITSRIALKINNEREVAVTPLAVPPTRDFGFSKNDLNEYAAVRLFVSRAKTARQEFVFSEENAAAIAEICRRLDGLPLAVELAAARIKLLAPKEILVRLENSLKLLSGGAKNLPERRRTMFGAIEWSYELLEDEEKSLFRRLAIFSGGFTVEAAEAVCNENKFKKEDSEISNPAFQEEILDLLASLIDNNLLETKEQTDGGVRLKMLEVIREFAFECLKKSGELEILQESHTDFYLNLAEKAEPHLTGENLAEWLEKLEFEINNIRAALNWSLKKDVETAGRIAGATRYFWSNHNYLTEGREWMEKILEKSEEIPNAVRFKLLNALGQFARNQGDLSASQKFNEVALKAGKAANDLRQIAISAHGLAAIATRQGDFKTAQKFNEEELEIARDLNDEYIITIALSALGDLAIARGKPAAARPLIEESLALSEKSGNTYCSSVNFINLGAVAYDEGNYEEAYKHFAESLTAAQSLGNKTLISCSLDGFAAVAASFENNKQAAQLAGAAEKLRESIGYEIEPTERIFRDAYVAKIHAALDEKSFDDAFEDGRELSLQEALALTSKEDFINIESSEIVIEKHTFERIIIEEEIVETEI